MNYHEKTLQDSIDQTNHDRKILERVFGEEKVSKMNAIEIAAERIAMDIKTGTV